MLAAACACSEGTVILRNAQLRQDILHHEILSVMEYLYEHVLEPEKHIPSLYRDDVLMWCQPTCIRASRCRRPNICTWWPDEEIPFVCQFLNTSQPPYSNAGQYIRWLVCLHMYMSDAFIRAVIAPHVEWSEVKKYASAHLMARIPDLQQQSPQKQRVCATASC